MADEVAEGGGRQVESERKVFTSLFLSLSLSSRSFVLFLNLSTQSGRGSFKLRGLGLFFSEG